MTVNSREAIASYVTDMLALERHIEKALSGQIADLDEAPDMVRELRVIQQNCESHIRTLDAIAERREDAGQKVSEAVKKAATTVLGLGAAAVDFLRTEKLPKDLRDDYTAVSLACIGYVMLHTTAKVLDDAEVADVAHRHLQDHARAVMTLHSIIPVAVVEFLRKDGHTVDESVLPEIADNLRKVWRSDSDSGLAQTSQSWVRSSTETDARP